MAVNCLIFLFYHYASFLLIVGIVTAAPPKVEKIQLQLCDDLSGEWVGNNTEARLILTQEIDHSLIGFYNPGPNFGLFPLEGRTATNKPTFGFVIIWSGGRTVSSFAGKISYDVD